MITLAAMKSVIVGTAGHIDHGKTALVKALTGIDADRLEEEKRRGITIDIGFAHLELPLTARVAASGSAGQSLDTVRLGFVDVPGHERFVRNMLAGVGGIDLVLLIIAADESIKPQTREHFDICRMLNIRRGITVLTKADLVDEDTLEVVRLEVEDFLRGSFLEGAPIVAVSSLMGRGVQELKQELARMALEVPSRDSRALFRLPIDRVFTMKGFGTVVTGTLISGSVRKEDELEVFPTGRHVRVRGIQVHGAAATEALAGQRTALNLAGTSTEDLARGMTLAPVGLLRNTRKADVQITLLPGARPLRDRARVHFHSYTAETIAEVVLLGGETAPAGAEATVEAVRPGGRTASARETSQSAPAKNAARAGATTTPIKDSNPQPVAQPGTVGPRQLSPGQTAWAQLRFREPLLLLPADRFILRQFSPVVTIGGGAVVDAAPLPARARTDRGNYLQVLRFGSPEEVLKVRIANRVDQGLSIADAVAETGWLRSRIEEMLKTLIQEKQVLRFGDVLVAPGAFEGAKLFATTSVRDFHGGNPLVAGISREELRDNLNFSPEVFSGVLDHLLRERKIEVTGEQVRLAGRGVVMKDEEAESKRHIELAFATAGLRVPALKEVLAGLKVDRSRAQQIVTLLLRDRVLIKVSEDLVFHRDTLDRLRRMIAEYKKTSTKLDVSRFKDLTGVTRKYAIPLLEYLDRERVTRRMGDERIIL
jgi:selenocysteine-specific elongation factor